MNPEEKYFPPATKVYRNKIVEGVSIPAFIHNGDYFFTDLDVYEDGRVSCWNFQDFAHFKEDVRRGWIALGIPDGKGISVHGLGSWEVTDGAWIFDKDSFVEYVLTLIKGMNPEMENLFTYRQKLVNGIRVGEMGTGNIYKPHNRHPNDSFPERIKGDSVNLFYQLGTDHYLVKLTVFADHTINIGRLEKPIDISFAELQALVEKKIIVTELPVQTKVHIYGLGSCTFGENDYVTDVQEMLLEIKDMMRELNGEPDTISMCRQAYEDYMKNPTAANKEQLKISYENVPEHNRMFVGDMDTKDIPVRMIIYGEQEIENWSHYQVAKHKGDALPVLKLPKEKEE